MLPYRIKSLRVEKMTPRQIASQRTEYWMGGRFSMGINV